MSVSYDPAEPSCHSYLGNRLRDLKLQQLITINPHSLYQILLIPLPDVVLFPRETIPLRLHEPGLVENIKVILRCADSLTALQSAEHAPLLGVVSTSLHRNGRVSLSSHGTTVEIKSSHCNSTSTSDFRSVYDEAESTEEMLLTGKGKHRFKIKHIRTVSRGVHFAEAYLYQDEVVPRCKPHPATQSFPNWVYTVNSPQVLAKQAYKLVETSMLWTAQSKTVRCRWGPLNLVARESDYLSSTTEAASANNSTTSCTIKRRRGDFSDGVDSSDYCNDGTPQNRCNDEFKYSYGAELDPVGFSYFLSANLPLPTAALQQLLAAEDSVARLRLSIELIERGMGKVLACCVCSLPLAGKQQVFTVPGAEGVTGAYVNPHGAVHQTTTVRKLLREDAVILHGSPTVQDTWFPGYAWTIVSCARCLNHLGWKFTIFRESGTVTNRAVRTFAGINYDPDYSLQSWDHASDSDQGEISDEDEDGREFADDDETNESSNARSESNSNEDQDSSNGSSGNGSVVSASAGYVDSVVVDTEESIQPVQNGTSSISININENIEGDSITDVIEQSQADRVEMFW